MFNDQEGLVENDDFAIEVAIGKMLQGIDTAGDPGMGIGSKSILRLCRRILLLCNRLDEMP